MNFTFIIKFSIFKPVSPEWGKCMFCIKLWGSSRERML